MGISKWLARKLTVGGTARTLARQYKWYRQNKFKESASDKLIFNEMIIFRFKFPETQKLTQMVDSGEINGLKQLTIEFLTIEAGFKENTIEMQIMFSEVIEEELIKKNIPLNII